MKYSSQKYHSVISPVMDPFITKLFKVLENLPNNPNPSFKGFCIAWWNDRENILKAQSFGNLTEESKFKHLYLASKQATQVFYFNETRSKDFSNEKIDQYPGGIKLGSNSAGVSGHDPFVNEAISTLWLIAQNVVDLGNLIDTKSFWDEFIAITHIVQDNLNLSDNKWISIIAEMMKKIKTTS